VLRRKRQLRNRDHSAERIRAVDETVRPAKDFDSVRRERIDFRSVFAAPLKNFVANSIFHHDDVLTIEAANNWFGNSGPLRYEIDAGLILDGAHNGLPAIFIQRSSFHHRH